MPLLGLQNHRLLEHHHRKLNHLSLHRSPLGNEIGFDECYRGFESEIEGNKTDDGTDLGCGCVDVGFEMPAAIRKFLFQPSKSRCLMLGVKRGVI